MQLECLYFRMPSNDDYCVINYGYVNSFCESGKNDCDCDDHDDHDG